MQRAPVSSRRRAGCGAPRPTAARAVLLRVAVNYILLSSNLVQVYATGAFSVRGLELLVAVVCDSARVFLKDIGFRRLKTRNFFWPRRGARSQVLDLAL